MTALDKKIVQGKFWTHVKALIWEKAQELFVQEQTRKMNYYIPPEAS
ncbi:hypothetical protein G4O51_07120 [Candidatus Bathyarchaeota archaeon A05DMB-2]|jgi:hypothetical protein|nr:hypothetical protein [Candidatus Bathyarchaeota archaeon A05DMB-2]